MTISLSAGLLILRPVAGLTLVARGALLDEQWLYRWRMPADTSRLETLVEEIRRALREATAAQE